MSAPKSTPANQLRLANLLAKMDADNARLAEQARRDREAWAEETRKWREERARERETRARENARWREEAECSAATFQTLLEQLDRTIQRIRDARWS
jgi:hypothetical protein